MHIKKEKVIEFENGKKEVILSQPSLADLNNIAEEIFPGIDPNQLKLLADYNRAIHLRQC